MTNFLKNSKKYLIIVGLYILFIMLFSILNYAGLFINNTKYIIILVTFVFSFVCSYKEGKERQNKGYIAGIKTSLIIISILILIDFILIHSTFNIKRVLYYLLILLISIFGSITGINKKAANGH